MTKYQEEGKKEGQEEGGRVAFTEEELKMDEIEVWK